MHFVRVFLWCILLILGQNHCWCCCGNILEKDQWCWMEHFHASRALLSAKVHARATPHHRVLLGCCQTEADSGCLLVVTKWHQHHCKESFTCRKQGFFQGCSFKDKYTKAGGYPDYQPKSIRQHCLQEKAFTCSQTSSFQKYNDLVRAMKLIFQKRQKTWCKHIALVSACYTHTLVIFCT